MINFCHAGSGVDVYIIYSSPEGKDKKEDCDFFHISCLFSVLDVQPVKFVKLYSCERVNFRAP